MMRILPEYTDIIPRIEWPLGREQWHVDPSYDDYPHEADELIDIAASNVGENVAILNPFLWNSKQLPVTTSGQPIQSAMGLHARSLHTLLTMEGIAFWKNPVISSRTEERQDSAGLERRVARTKRYFDRKGCGGCRG